MEFQKELATPGGASMTHARNSRTTSFLRFAGALAAFCMFIAMAGSSALAGQAPPVFIKSADMSG
ncbi:MAG: hypothetical protein ACRD27_10185, partial [Terracidiphilus sp.]